MIVGVECTAHTFGVGVVKNGKVLANVRDMYTTESGGIVPSESASHHEEVAGRVWADALEEAGVSEKDITGIAVSNAPGLAPCLHVGVRFASEKAAALNVPLVGVNHCVAHLEIGQSVGATDPVLLYASGANTQVVAFANGKYRVFGETLDLGVGNFLDKLAREMGFGFPGGPEIERKADGGNYVELPYSIKGMDISLSGMETKVKQLLKKGERVEDLCFSVQETAFAMLVEAAERALAHTGKKELVLGGGVGCNVRLQEMCQKMCADRGARFFCPSRGLLVDNGAMIAYLGEVMLRSGVDGERPEAADEDGLRPELTGKNDQVEGSGDGKWGDGGVDGFSEVEVKPRERTDMVSVSWR
jgi:glycoprotease/Kae1 family metallohydrolase